MYTTMTTVLFTFHLKYIEIRLILFFRDGSIKDFSRNYYGRINILLTYIRN